ncbi:DUF6270 domain-containing protein [Brachybacterium sp. AOP29-B2-41]|uniref:DUF6270 domain-containing protein n=1 Tax=Brachybacterium sp. AOP29-B2-41 TaxID=3457704 RepID=UPI0040341AE4
MSPKPESTSAAEGDDSAAPTNVFIWGSCVSRDTFGFLPEEFTLARYVARQSLISAGTNASSVRSQITDPASKFQARMILGDLTGDLYRSLEQHAAETDIVLVDLVDERGGVIDFGDAYATKLSEFWGAGGRDASRGASQIPFGTDGHFALWQEGARRFVGALRAAELLPRTLVLHSPWASEFDTGEQLEIQSWMKDPATANQEYTRYVTFLRDCGLQVAELPPELAKTSRDHQWGPSPFHYQNSAYEYFANAITSVTDSAAETVRREPFPRRDTSAWGDGDFTDVSTPSEIPATLPESLYLTIWHNGYPLDLYVENLGAPTTLVSFHAALGGSGLKPPIFTGRAISAGSGMNRIFVSDPGLLTADDLGLAWYLGTNSLYLTALLTEAIRELQSRMSAKHLVFFGMSGGGFAALNFSHEFPGSLALPVNPQTRILDYAEIHWDAMARACFGTADTAQSRAALESHPRADLRAVYAAGFANTVIYVQNSADAHVSTQLIPWFEAVSWRQNAMLLFGDWGNGHVPPPAVVLKKLIESIASADGDWVSLARGWHASVQPSREMVKQRTGR